MAFWKTQLYYSELELELVGSFSDSHFNIKNCLFVKTQTFDGTVPVSTKLTAGKVSWLQSTVPGQVQNLTLQSSFGIWLMQI